MRCLTLIAVLLASLGCGREPGPRGTRGPRVALVLKTLNSPFFIDMQRGAQEAAARLGVDLVVQAAEREVDVDKQMQIIENLIQTGVAALCITPAGSKEIVPAVVKANQAGIPVIVVDTRLDAAAAAEAKARVETFIGSDNYEGGKIAGQHLLAVTKGKARVGVLEGIPGHETGDSRLRGFRDALQAAPGVTIAASQTANWERDQGYGVAQNMLQAHPDMDTIFACNDMMALGAIEAIATAGKTGKIRVIGFDAVEDARKAIEAGTLIASVAQFPDEMGRQAVESAHALLQGRKPPPEIVVRIELVAKKPAAAAR